MARATERKRRAGKIAILALIVILLVVVLIGMLGNAGHTVHQKLETQHAADAVAFSSAMWMSRGLNTITTSNHLMGEAMAMGVVHDALGGVELRLELTINTTENRILDRVIQALVKTAPAGTIPSAYFPQPIPTIDGRILQAVARRTSPATAEELTAFGMLYDSRMTLKRKLAGWLAAKSVANLSALVVIPVLYEAAAMAAWGVHIAGTSQIVLIGKEWLFLEAIEVYASAAAPIQTKAFEEQLIPGLWAFSYQTAGIATNTESDGGAQGADDSSGAPSTEDGLVNQAIEDTLTEHASTHDVEAAIVPTPQKLKLPVVPEPRPRMQGAGGSKPAGWGSDAVIPVPTALGPLGDLNDQLARFLTRSFLQQQQLRSNLQELNDLLDDLDERLAADDLDASVLPAAQQERAELVTSIAELEDELSELVQASNDMNQQRQELDDLLQSIPGGESQNLSLRHIPSAMNPDEERRTQWVRAAYPNVDALRAPLLAMMERHLPLSRAEEHFTKWTNRYSLIKAWQFRSGQRLRKSGSSAATWQATDAGAMRLLVLPDSFRGQTPNKGAERWTTATVEGRRAAEQYFTALAVCRRDYRPLISPRVFKTPHDHGLTTVAQAIVYNANPQQANVSNDSSTQPQVGWDTLNWDFSQRPIPEWEAEPSRQSMRWPWELLQGLEQAPVVKLNWQPKLVPVTASRLADANAEVDGAMQPAIELAIDHSELLRH